MDTAHPSFRPLVVCCLVAAIACIMCPAGLAMAPQEPEDRLISLWADAHYGDDAQARQANPNCATANRDPNHGGGCATSAQWWPNDHMPNTTGPNQSCCSGFTQEILLHAPWPFKTVTGAINYLQFNDPVNCAAPPPVLPMGPTTGYVSPCTNRRWTYSVIHLLPGHYGRFDPLQPQYLPNGLFPNGETFPIHLPDGVSIQGTSALNVYFDLWDYDEGFGVGPAFAFGGTVPGVTPPTYAFNGIDSFIDSVSIFGAFVSEGEPHPGLNSAIYISEPGDGTTVVAPTITNCWLFGNGVGILVDAVRFPVSEPPGYDSMIRATVVNNTFAWNGIGVWNGEIAQPSDSQGLARVNLINNIFDSVPVASALQGLPAHWWNFVAQGVIPPPACFEGVSLHDLTVLAIAPGTYRDYNAYEANLPTPDKYNTGQAFPWLNLPPTAPRPGGGGSPASPGVDIRPITDGGNPLGTHRGILYVRDLLFAGSLAGIFGLSTGFDLSPGDFRLSPNTIPAWDNTLPQPPFAPGSAQSGNTAPFNGRNPCIDRGWSLWPATMQNGMVLEVPGRLAAVYNNGTWTFDYTKNDCEGYGNPRIQVYAAYYPGGFQCPSPPEPCLTIDLGADEAGELIGIGYRFGTTFIVHDPGLPSYDNRFLWWIGPSSTLHGSPPFGGANVRPYYTRPGVTGCWDYPHYNDPAQTCALAYYQPTGVDIMPHLLPDLHPWWSLPQPPFPSNPIWQCWRFCGSTPPVSNHFLYEHPVAGVPNPPGTGFGPYTDPNLRTFNYLDGFGNPTAAMFGPFPGAGFPPPPQDFHNFDQWLRAADLVAPNPQTGPDVHGATSIPFRYSVEFPDQGPWGRPSNIQSFMVWVK